MTADLPDLGKRADAARQAWNGGRGFTDAWLRVTRAATAGLAVPDPDLPGMRRHPEEGTLAVGLGGLKIVRGWECSDGIARTDDEVADWTPVTPAPRQDMAPPAAVEPVLDLDALEESVRAGWRDALKHGRPGAQGIAAAVGRHVAPIIAAARQSTAPTDPAELANDPKVAAAVLTAETAALEKRTYEARGELAQWAIDYLHHRVQELDPPEPVDPPMVRGQIRQREYDLYRRLANGRWVCITTTAGWEIDEEMRGCDVILPPEARARLGLGGDK